MQNIERLDLLFQRIGDFLGGALGQRAVFEQSNDFADEFLVILGELRTAADFFCPQPFQKVASLRSPRCADSACSTSALVAVTKVLFVLVEQTIELARDVLPDFLGVGGFQDFRGGEEINRRGIGTGRRCEEKLVELAPAEISEQRGKLFDGGVGSQASCRTGFLRQPFDALEKFGVLVADFADFGEVFQFAFLVARLRR